MVASGLPERNGNMHALHIADMALNLRAAMVNFEAPEAVKERLGDRKLRVRIGLHSGKI